LNLGLNLDLHTTMY